MESYLQKIATGPKMSKDLTEEEAEDALTLVLNNEISPVRAGVFLIAARMKLETVPENLGYWKAMHKITHKHSVPFEKLLQVADPFDGFNRSPYFGSGVVCRFGTSRRLGILIQSFLVALDIQRPGFDLVPASEGRSHATATNSSTLMQWIDVFMPISYPFERTIIRTPSSSLPSSKMRLPSPSGKSRISTTISEVDSDVSERPSRRIA